MSDLGAGLASNTLQFQAAVDDLFALASAQRVEFQLETTGVLVETRSTTRRLGSSGAYYEAFDAPCWRPHLGRSRNALPADDLQFEIRGSPRRKTLELIVERGGEFIIAAVDDLDESVMEDFVREKRFWLYTKITEKEARRHETPDKEFVDGEGFPYLGRSYRLLLVDDQDAPLKLVNGRFRLRRELADDGRDVFVEWYTGHADAWLDRRVDEWAGRMGVDVSGIEVRDLGFRWGSCSSSGTVNFHWATILLPASIVDYVIVHELAHLVEPHHTTDFWEVVERAMPGYERRKAWLAEKGHAIILP